jgi:Serine/threonine protein kinase
MRDPEGQDLPSLLAVTFSRAMPDGSQLVGHTLGHYRIVEQIGAAGMGVVYRARDEQLERDVAVKVLPPSTLLDESSRKRFRKEALALARLNHPNVATVHEFGSQDTTDFLVSKYPGCDSRHQIGNRSLAIALELRERADLGPQQRYRLIGIGLSKFREPEVHPARPLLFE